MIIGITTTYVEEEQKDEIVPVERVTVEYVRRVAAAGAVPVLLPPVEGGADANRRAARELVERLDGLVLAGGGDLNPATYGDEARLAETVNVFDGRDALELELARLAHERDLPMLGICRGMQVLNVALGGTLYQDVHACGLTDAAHQQKPPYDVVRQRVDIAPGSVLDRVLCDGAGEGMVPGCKAGWPASLETSWEGIAPAPHSLLVNTMHHQAIACVADPLQVSATVWSRVWRTHRGASTSACSGILSTSTTTFRCSKPWLPPRSSTPARPLDRASEKVGAKGQP